MAKDEGAFRTIGEVSTATGVPQHVLRYWEGRFPQLRPLQRSGNRRYYRPADVALVRRIQRLLTDEGYTMRGVQRLLAEGGAGADPAPEPADPAFAAPAPAPAPPSPPDIRAALQAIRGRLAQALEADAAG